MESSTAYMLIGAAFIVGYVLGRASPAATLPAPVPPDADALEAVRPILVRDGKIAAIKAYRELTQTGLRDAKLAVETLE